MITVVEGHSITKEAPYYPCLKKTQDGVIVLFTDIKKGTVLSWGSTGCGVAIGYHTESWNEQDFELLKNPITLSNV